MKKIALVIITVFVTVALSAQTATNESKFIARFQFFVTSVEKCKKIPSEKWDSLNTVYKDFRMEFKAKYKKTMNNADYKKYNELKVRYLKQCSLRRLGSTITKKAQTVEGAIDGVFKK